MPTYDYICEVCGHHDRAYRKEEQGPPRFCSRDCRKLSKTPMRRGKPIKYVITSEMHNQIRAAYQGDTGSGQIRDLAIQLELPRWKVTRYAIAQGFMAKQKKEPEWTARELKLLERYAHLAPVGIQKRLKKYGYHRTEVGIVLKRKRMRFLQNLNGHSAQSVAKSFGIDVHSIMRYIKNGWLIARKRGTQRTEIQGGDMYYIKDKDIRNFIIENVEVVDFRKLDKYWLVNLLAGKRMKKTKTISLRAKQENRREKRAFAAMHCVYYAECLDRVAKRNGQLECHKCDRMKFERDHYLKEVGAHMINHCDPGSCAIRIDESHGYHR